VTLEKLDTVIKVSFATMLLGVSYTEVAPASWRRAHPRPDA
jgi:hypothetical protein